MASKGKDKIKFKKNEIKFKDKHIDLKRFAYDVIKYTTVKFGLPEDCISVWDGSDNDYGCDDFCLVVTREIIGYQIVGRYHYLASFDKLNGHASFDVIGRLLQDVMYNEMAKPQYDIIDKVEISLSVLGELLLYLYTKDIDLNLKQLMDYWFDCHLHIKKKSFEAAGGLTKMYDRNRKPKFDRYDHFNNLFIKNHCLPYKDTASNPNLKELYTGSYCRLIQKNAASFSPTDCKEVKEVLLRSEEMVIRQSECKGLKIPFGITEVVAVPSKLVKPSRIKLDEDSGVNIPVNTGLGIPEHHELYGLGGPLGAAAPPSQDIPEVSPMEKTQSGRRPSARERMQMRKASYRLSLEPRPLLDSSKIKESRNKEPIDDPKPSRNLSRTDLETEQILREENADSVLKTQLKKAGFRPSLDQGPGILEHHRLYGIGGHSVTVVPPSRDLPGVSTEEKTRQDSRKLSAREKMQMSRTGVRPSLEECLGQLSLNSSKTKQCMKKGAI